MASTYPLEVVQAARFVKDNPNLKGDQLDEKLKEQSWDDSVKSLVFFPQVLTLMDGKLDWTQKLGDAVLDQQKELMDAVQRLRARAQAEGNLKSTAEQTVTSTAVAAPPVPGQPPPSQTVVVQQAPAQVIKIEPASPQVVYVPSYNPTVVYGTWPYPAAPPYYPYPPGYAFGAAALSFGVGMAVGAAVWGNCNWGGGNVDVNVNQNANFSRNVNRTDVASQRTQRAQQGQAGNRSQWQHNPENRRGVQYRDQSTQQRYNRGSNPQATQSREAFRGRADQGRQDLGRGGAGGAAAGRAAAGPRGVGRPRAVARRGRPERRRAWADRSSGGRSSGGREAGAFQGVGGSGADARNFSDRGQSSRQSIGASGGGGARATRRGPEAAGVEAAVAAVGAAVVAADAAGVAGDEAVPEGSMMRQSRTRGRGGRWLRLIGIVLVTAGLAAEWGSSAFAAVTQRRFASAEEAAQALVDAFRSGDRRRRCWPSSATRASGSSRPATRCPTAAPASASWPRTTTGTGSRPGEARSSSWWGATTSRSRSPSCRTARAGASTPRPARRRSSTGASGENELNTIQVCLAYVDAQREYYARDPDGDALLQYAQKFASSPGRRDGLYWPTKPGEPPSPLGPLVARARDEGYRKTLGEAPSPTGATTSGS